MSAQPRRTAAGTEAPRRAAPKRLTVDDIRQSVDLRETAVLVDEWGGEIVLRALTLQEARDVQRASFQGDEPDSLKADLLVLSKAIVDPVIAEADMYLLAQKNTGVVLRLVELVNALSGGTPSEVAALLETFRS